MAKNCQRNPFSIMRVEMPMSCFGFILAAIVRKTPAKQRNKTVKHQNQNVLLLVFLMVTYWQLALTEINYGLMYLIDVRKVEELAKNVKWVCNRQKWRTKGVKREQKQLEFRRAFCFIKVFSFNSLIKSLISSLITHS